MSESRGQNRIQVDPAHTTGAIGRLFAEIRAKFSLVPNLFRVLANPPAAGRWSQFRVTHPVTAPVGSP